MLDDLSLFATVVEAGSLNSAAQQRNIPAATLTRRLQKLEAHLGCKLLHRSTRGIQLTQEGRDYYERCQPLLAALQQTTQEIHTHLTEPVGVVRVLAPINLAVSSLHSFWTDFLHRYPAISLDLQLDNRNDNLLTQAADLALRIGNPGNPSYMQRRLGSVATAIVAAPAYLNAHPPIRQPQDLHTHAWLLALPLSTFTLRRDHETVTIRIGQSRMRANEIRLCTQLASSGLGLAYLPCNQCADELADGRLVRVLPEWQTPIRDIYAVWPPQKALPARVRVMLDCQWSLKSAPLWAPKSAPL